MLRPAILYKAQLDMLAAEIAFDEKYKFYHMSYPNLTFNIDDHAYEKIQLVSINGNNVVGYFSAYINRPGAYIKQIMAVNFTDNKFVFGKDLRCFIDRLLKTYFKINFTVVCGNPIEISYDKMVEKYGGRIVGVFEKDVLLMDNKWYDIKHYEIFSKECTNA